jgi:hypothetical protein
MNIDSGLLEWESHFLGVYLKNGYNKDFTKLRKFIFHSPSLIVWIPVLIGEIYIGLKEYVFFHYIFIM